MRVSDIIKGEDQDNRIVQWHQRRTAKRRSDLLDSIDKNLSELEGLSRGVEASEGLDIDAAIYDAKEAISRLKMALFG